MKKLFFTAVLLLAFMRTHSQSFESSVIPDFDKRNVNDTLTSEEEFKLREYSIDSLRNYCSYYYVVNLLINSAFELNKNIKYEILLRAKITLEKPNCKILETQELLNKRRSKRALNEPTANLTKTIFNQLISCNIKDYHIGEALNIADDFIHNSFENGDFSGYCYYSSRKIELQNDYGLSHLVFNNFDWDHFAEIRNFLMNKGYSKSNTKELNELIHNWMGFENQVIHTLLKSEVEELNNTSKISKINSIDTFMHEISNGIVFDSVILKKYYPLDNENFLLIRIIKEELLLVYSMAVEKLESDNLILKNRIKKRYLVELKKITNDYFNFYTFESKLAKDYFALVLSRLFFSTLNDDPKLALIFSTGYWENRIIDYEDLSSYSYDYINPLFELVRKNRKSNNYSMQLDSAIKLYFNVLKNNIKKNILILDNSHFKNLLEEFDYRTEVPIRYLILNSIDYKESIATLTDLLIFRKNAILYHESKRNCMSKNLISCFKKNWANNQIDSLINNNISSQIFNNLYKIRIGNKIDKYLEHNNFDSITELLESSAMTDSKLDITWRQLQIKLNTNDAIIDFFPSYKIDNEKFIYASLIKKEFNNPILIEICKVSELKNIREENLYNLILGKLKKYIEHNSSIYYSTSDILNSISLGSLYHIKNGKRVYLIDEYNLHQLFSTRELFEINSSNLPRNDSNKITLFGGIDFNKITLNQIDSSYSNLTSTNISFDNSLISSTDNDALRFGLNYLPGTKKEVENISSVMQQNNWQVKLEESVNATENNFKAMSGENAPTIIHVATHGFAFEEVKNKTNYPSNFMPLKNGMQYQTVSDPMLRSGLLFSGANISWKGKADSIIKATNEDGILTSRELSQLDLSKTKLAVLSACETGRGLVVANEGTFGLQRALKLAGVENIIVSLWKVPDDTTQEMMTLFYEKLATTRNIEASFNYAQKTMRNKYPNEPIKWGGFVLIR